MRIPDRIQKELDLLTVPWRVEPGKKHQKIYVGDRMVGVIARNATKSSEAGKGGLAVVSQIRRAARDFGGVRYG